MRILISNDDGITAPGIAALAHAVEACSQGATTLAETLA